MAVIVAAAILAIGGVYCYDKYQPLNKNQNIYAQAEAQKEIKSLVAAISKLMELPTGETPTLATVQDKDKIKDQLFFKNAQNGDKLLVYTKAMKVILYRPSTKKIIEVSSIGQQTDTNQQKITSIAPSSLKIAYYNGTETAGLSREAENNVKKAYPDYKTSTLTNAFKRDYKETLVADIAGNHNKEASDLARMLGGKTGPLPDGEVRPDADILIISGK